MSPRRIAHWIVFGAVCLAGATTVALMFMMTGDALGRVIGRPIRGAFELSQLMMALVVFLPLAYVQKLDGHVRMTFGTRWLPVRVQGLLDALGAALGTGLYGLLAYLAYRHGLQALETGHARTGIVTVRTWPFVGAMAVGALLLTLQCLGTFISHVKALRREEPRRDGPSGPSGPGAGAFGPGQYA